MSSFNSILWSIGDNGILYNTVQVLLLIVNQYSGTKYIPGKSSIGSNFTNSFPLAFTNSIVNANPKTGQTRLLQLIVRVSNIIPTVLGQCSETEWFQSIYMCHISFSTFSYTIVTIVSHFFYYLMRYYPRSFEFFNICNRSFSLLTTCL